MSDYDRLIQLCDSLAGSEGVLDIEEHMGDVKQRYGYYPQEKWDSNIRLKNTLKKKPEKIYMRQLIKLLDYEIPVYQDEKSNLLRRIEI